MTTLWSDFADNLSEIHKKECKACMERKRSECDFIGFNKNKLRYKCEECEKYG